MPDGIEPSGFFYFFEGEVPLRVYCLLKRRSHGTSLQKAIRRYPPAFSNKSANLRDIRLLG